MFKFHVQADVGLRRADRALTASEREELALAIEGALLCNNWLAAQTLGQRLCKLLRNTTPCPTLVTMRW